MTVRPVRDGQRWGPGPDKRGDRRRRRTMGRINRGVETPANPSEPILLALSGRVRAKMPCF
jgi:hypothetical protein